MLKVTFFARRIETKVSTFLDMAAAHSAIGRIARLVGKKVISVVITFVAPIGYASR